MIVRTVTGRIVNSDAVNAYNDAYWLTGDRASALGWLHNEAEREDWARRIVARAGKDWATHLMKFDGTVLPRGYTVEGITIAGGVRALNTDPFDRSEGR